MNCTIVIPLKSKKGSGMCRAGISLLNVIPPEYCPKESRWNCWFERINDSGLPNFLKMLLRLFVVQLTVAEKSQFKIYASHHAPLFPSESPHMMIIHDLISLENPKQHFWQTLLFKYYVPLAVRNAKYVIAISSFTRRKILEHFHLDTQKIPIIPSAFDTIERWKRGGVDFDHRFSNNQFLFVGGQYKHKNLNLLVRAIERINDSSIHVKVVNGERTIWLPLLDKSEQEVFYSQFEFVDYLSDRDLEEMYEQSLALVYVSKTEGFGIPPLEAFHKGCPVICSDIDVLKETCGEAANFVDPNNVADLVSVISRLIDNQRNWSMRDLIQAGYIRVDQFQLSEIMKKWRVFLGSDIANGRVEL